MRLTVVPLAASLALAFVSSFAVAQTETPATTTTAPATQPKTRLHTVVGHVVTVDPAAKTLIVKRRGWHGKELSFAVEEPAAPTLADLHPGDRVRVRYSDTDGKLDATAIEVTHRAKS